jgi:hypothetical protein
LIIVWTGTPTTSDFNVIEDLTTNLAAGCPNGIGLLIIIVEGYSKPPSPDVRKRNGELVEQFADRLWGMARVVEGRGLKLTVVRFALSTIDMMSTSSIPEKTVESVAEAVQWMATMRPNLSPSALNAAVRAVRESVS